MTVIVAMEHPGGVTVACDSFLGNDDVRVEMVGPKWWKAGALLVAWAGGVKIPQVVEHAGWRMRQRKNEPDQAFVQRYAERIRAQHIEKRIACSESSYLLVYHGKCYEMETSDASLTRSGHGYAAIGHGEEYALGAMAYSLAREPLLGPQQRLEYVLDAVLLHCPKVAKDWHFEFVPTDSRAAAQPPDGIISLGEQVA